MKPYTNHRTAFFFFLSILFTTLLLSCKNYKEKGNSSFRTESLELSRKEINLNISSRMHELEDRVTDPISADRAEPWFKIATQSHEKVMKADSFILNLLKKDKIEKDSLKVLFQLLENVRNTVLQSDEEIAETFKNTDVYFLSNKGSNNVTEEDFIKCISGTRNQEELKQNLTMLQNNMQVFLSKIIRFCIQKNTYTVCGFDSYSTIVGASSKVVEPGDEVEIFAGIGAFSKASMPKILIDGKNIPLNEEGYAKLKLKSPARAGKYEIPVRITFFNQTTGKEDTVKSTVEYKVVKICE